MSHTPFSQHYHDELDFGTKELTFERVATINRISTFLSPKHAHSFAQYFPTLLEPSSVFKFCTLRMDFHLWIEMQPFEWNGKRECRDSFVTRILCSMITSELDLLAIVRFIILRHGQMGIANDFLRCKAYLLESVFRTWTKKLHFQFNSVFFFNMLTSIRMCVLFSLLSQLSLDIYYVRWRSLSVQILLLLY